VPPEPANTSLLISSYDIGGSEADPPLKQVSFNFAKIDYEFRPQRADGSLAKPIHAGWDLKLNKKV
jgi:type VI secretion system secreted protein Hcp